MERQYAKGAYEYVPLPGDSSFRLLELLPGSKADEVQFRLFLADWTAVPRYEAISYVWGDHTDTVDATCEPGRYKVKLTRNLSDAISSFRFEARSRMLWADAICIDQTNDPERSHQVNNMSKIYNSATEVLVWLGEAVEGSAMAMSLFEAVAAKIFRQALTLGLDFRVQAQESGWQRIYDAYPTTEEDVLGMIRSNWKDIDAFLQRPWFSRLWVVQEANSSPPVIAFCGQQSMDWHTLSIAALAAGQDNFGGSACASAVLRRFDYTTDVNVIDVLHWARHLDTTDPRDKIYGALSLINPSLKEHSISANYSWTKDQVYQDAAECILKKMNSLQMLSHLQPEEVGDGASVRLPSWVPCWDEKLQFNVLDHTAYDAHADASQPANLTISSTASLLVASGISYAHITVRHPLDAETLFPYAKADTSDSASYRAAFWEDVFRTIDNPNISRDQLLIQYAVTLTGGLRYGDAGHRSGRADRPGLRASLLEYFKTYCPTLQLPTDLQDPPVATALPHLRKFLQLANRYCWGRSVFVTENGSVGLGPRIVRPGDLVCVLFGSACPVVLRPHGSDQYAVLGWAFVDGIMDGELVGKWEEDCRNGRASEEKFQIC